MAYATELGGCVITDLSTGECSLKLKVDLLSNSNY